MIVYCIQVYVNTTKNKVNLSNFFLILIVIIDASTINLSYNNKNEKELWCIYSYTQKYNTLSPINLDFIQLRNFYFIAITHRGLSDQHWTTHVFSNYNYTDRTIFCSYVYEFLNLYWMIYNLNFLCQCYLCFLNYIFFCHSYLSNTSTINFNMFKKTINFSKYYNLNLERGRQLEGVKV